MNKSYLLAGVGISLVAFVIFFALNYKKIPVNASGDSNMAAAQSAMRQQPEGQNIYADGVLTKEGQGGAPGVWYVGLDVGGKRGYVELAFDDESMCISDSVAVQCSPNQLVEDTPVHIEGVVDGEVMLVLELTAVRPHDSAAEETPQLVE